MQTILIVDDEAEIREVLKEYATFNGYNTIEASNGYEALKKVEYKKIDLIIMDIMMPGLDGFSTIKMIKKNYDIPTIMLSARGEEYDKLFGFELGIEDYVTKPFSPREVFARIGVILKRKTYKPNTEEKYIVDGLEIDFSGRLVLVDGERAPLTPKEYDLLFFLVRNKGIAMSREKLLSEVWGYDFYGENRTVDTHIKMLRGNLGKYRDHIVTLRGMGYKFE